MLVSKSLVQYNSEETWRDTLQWIPDKSQTTPEHQFPTQRDPFINQIKETMCLDLIGAEMAANSFVMLILRRKGDLCQNELGCDRKF